MEGRGVIGEQMKGFEGAEKKGNMGEMREELEL